MNKTNRHSDNKTMHKATCAECKRNCEVPFKPSGNKPVLCRDCFGEQRNNAEPREFKNNKPKRDYSDRPSREEKQLQNIQDELSSLKKHVESLTRNITDLVKKLDKADTSTLKDVLSDVVDK